MIGISYCMVARGVTDSCCYGRGRSNGLFCSVGLRMTRNAACSASSDAELHRPACSSALRGVRPAAGACSDAFASSAEHMPNKLTDQAISHRCVVQQRPKIIHLYSCDILHIPGIHAQAGHHVADL